MAQSQPQIPDLLVQVIDRLLQLVLLLQLLLQFAIVLAHAVQLGRVLVVSLGQVLQVPRKLLTRSALGQLGRCEIRVGYILAHRILVLLEFA
jgi:hypothetical protein